MTEPCPPNCRFNWPKFHRMLDSAIAHYIEEIPHNLERTGIHRPLIDFMEYSNEKQLLAVRTPEALPNENGLEGQQGPLPSHNQKEAGE